VRVLGIDPSLTSTGIARIRHDGAVTTERIESAPPKRPRGDKTPVTVAERHARLHTIAAEVVVASRAPASVLAVIEGPSYASAGAGTWDRAGLWWTIVSRCMRSDVPVVIVPPRTRALWATGSGASSKAPIAVHLSRMWPDVDPGISDDEWDALALASMGAQHLGWLPVELARHREQLGKVAWPDIPTGAAA
jgi:Holliday junction resolvasome RuvABC endonuclease subunit